MRKTTKFFAIILSLVLLISALIMISSATETYPSASAEDGTPSFEIAYSDNTTEYFYTWRETVAAAKDNCVIKLLEDYEEGPIPSDTVNAYSFTAKEATLDLNGKTLASSWNTNHEGASTFQRTQLSGGSSLTVIGNGTIKSASSFFQIIGGTLTIDAGEGNTINFVAISGHKYSDNSPVASTFSGQPFFKIGSNGSANNPNVENSGNACTLNLYGNVTFKEENGGTAVGFIGAYPGSNINVGDPSGSRTFITATAKSTGSVFVDFLWFKSASTPIYDTVKAKGAFIPAKLDIENADINYPNGTFARASNYNSVKEFADAARININDTDLNLDGKGSYRNVDFQFSTNAYVYATLTNTKIVSDSTNVIYAGASTHIPNSLTILKDCHIDTACYTGEQQPFRYSGTVIIDGGYYDITGDRFFAVGYSWTTKDTHASALASSGLAATTALPEYADEANSAKEWYVGGYGHTVKNGTAFASTPPGANSPAKYNNAFTAYSIFDQDAEFRYHLRVLEDGTLSRALLLENTNALDNVLIGHPSGKTASSTNVDFSNESIGSYTYSNVSTIKAVSINAADKRAGRWDIAQSPSYFGNNKYLLYSHYYESGMISSTAHTSSGYNHNHGSQNSLNAIYNPIEDFYAYSASYDIMAPAGDFLSVTTGFQIRLPHDAISPSTVNYDYITPTFVISGDNNKLLVSNSHVADIVPGKWYRITGVLVFPRTENNEVDFTKLSDAKIDIYLDGVLVKTNSSIINSKYNFTSTNEYYKLGTEYTTKYANVEEIRTTFAQSSAASNQNEKTAIDNIVLQQWGRNYNGTSQTIAESVQNAYSMPENFPLAKVNGEEYFDFESALLSALAASAEGAVSVEIFQNVEGSVNLDDVSNFTLNYPITINTHGFNIDVSSEKYVVLEPDSQTVLVRNYENGDSATVKWYSENGELLASEIAIVGNQPAKKPVGEETKNGWYKVSYNSWSTSIGGEVVTDFTVTGPTSYYRAAPEVVAYPSAVMYNITLVAHLQINFCIPKDIPDDVEFVGIYGQYDENGEPSGPRPIHRTNVDYGNGVLYDEYSRSWPGIGRINSTTSASVVLVYKAHLPDGNVVDLEYQLTAKLVDYFTYVMTTGAYESVQGVVADLVQYIIEAQRALGKTPDENLISIYNTYPSKRTNLDTMKSQLASAGSQNYSAISNYVKSISFCADDVEPSFKLVLKPGVTNVSFKLEGYGNSKEPTLYNTSYITYGKRTGDSMLLYYDENNNIVKKTNNGYIVVDDDGNQIKEKTAGAVTNNIAILQSTGIPVYNLNMKVDIILTLSSGATASAPYDLATYYNAIKGDESAAVYLNFMASMRALGYSSAKYRYPAGPLKISDVADKALVVKYSDYGAVGDGITDDFAAIAAAHSRANQLVTRGFNNVTVEAEEGKTYYIGKNDAGTVAYVKTNTDWKNCKFIFDDSELKPFVDLEGNFIDREIEDASKPNPARTNPIFAVAPNENAVTVTGKITSLNIGDTNIGYKPGFAAVLHIENENVKHYIRHGVNANEGAAQQEVILVDKDGNIDPTTPVLWDYTVITKAILYHIDDRAITIKNASIETISNNAPNLYTSYNRNIRVSRSNVTVEGITHTLTNVGATRAPYSGIMYVSNAYNVTFKDTSVMHHENRYDESNKSLLGTYEFGANSAIGVKWINCRQTNFFTDEGKITYKGLFGTNYCRNVELDGCFLTSFDAHSGLHNATLKNSTFEHINFIGSGDIRIQNVNIYADYTKSAIKLRDDYGCTWKGNVYVDGLCMKYMDNLTELSVFQAYYIDHNFGYDCYFPINISINNLTTKKVVPTKISSGRLETDETVVAENALPIHLVKNLESVTVNTETATNKYYGTDTLTITNCPNVEWVLPNTQQFKDMKVYIDGKEVTNWKSLYGHK